MSRPAKPFRKGNFYYSDLGGRRTKLCHVSKGMTRAREILRELLSQRDKDGNKVYQDLSVAALFALFLKNVEAERTHHTFLDYQRWLTDFATLHGGRQARDVSRLDAQNYRNDLTKRTWLRGKKKGQPYKPKTVNHAVIALKRAWNWAIEMELIPGKNPFARTALLHAEGRKRTATEEEFQALVAKAAESLKTRITRRVAEAKGQEFLDRLGSMYVGTIHAYCLKLLQDHVPAYGNHDVLDENRLAGLLSREYKRLELSKIGPQHWRPIRDFMRNADVVENELIDRRTLLGTPFGDCYNEFCKTLDKYHFLTYGRLVAAAVHFLQTPAVFDRVHGRLRHLIVDEYQDVNPAQEKLIALLAQDPVQLCVVADDDQSIYQWRGSDVSHMLEFASRYDATPLMLSVNRRSRPGITGLFLQPEARVLGMLYAWLSKNDWKSERYGRPTVTSP